MMVPIRLPVAPRPFVDELLSSWLARVAARYGAEPLELMVYLAGQGGGTQARGRLTMWRRIWGCSGFGRRPAGPIRNGFGAGHWLPDILIGRGTGF
jgi:hypothetical protein